VILRYLLDTNTISEPARPQPHPGILKRLRQHDGEIALAAPVWHELWFGCERLPPSRKRTRIEDYLQTLQELPILPYDSAAAEWHATERARLTARGKGPSFLDGQIAATAGRHNLIVVTSNVSDFESFEGLRIEDWRE
jgi:tRNA(fMet)-specific endonuclease VapC